MTARVLPVALVLAALAADARDLHALAFYVLVAGVAAAAGSALSFFGELVEPPPGNAGNVARVQVALGALGLVCVLVAAAARGQGNEAEPAPAPAVSALFAALGVYAAQALAALYAPRSVRA